jgi:hypothetical protein
MDSDYLPLVSSNSSYHRFPYTDVSGLHLKLWEESFFTLVNNIDEMANFFTNKYIEMAKECIPTKVVNIRRIDKPWFNSEIGHHIRIRDRLHRKLKSSPTVHNRNIYKIRRNKVNNMIIHAKEQFYLNANGLLDENSNNPKKRFGHL